jgi:integrase
VQDKWRERCSRYNSFSTLIGRSRTPMQHPDIPGSSSRRLGGVCVSDRLVHELDPELFVNADGTPKRQAAVAGLIMNYLRRRAGIVLTPHQFRHLSAKVILDADPGGSTKTP